MLKATSYINGKFVETQEKISIISPETNKVIGIMTGLSKEHIQDAYKSARGSQQLWEEYSKIKRIKLMSEWSKLILQEKELIATIMTKEIAKPLKSSISEIERSVKYIEETISKYQKQESVNLKLSDTKSAQIILKPLGVILVISPFNYPINLSVTKLAPALLTGNTVVFKSATNGTLACSKMVELAHKVGFPKGVINFVTGKGSVIGDALISNKHSDAIMFTGGTETGLKIAQSSTMKHLMFELGGKDSAIILEDADLESTTNSVISGGFSYSGQRCTAIKRVFVHKNIKEKFVKLLTAKTNKLTIGKAIDNCDITALINNHSSNFVNELFNDAINKGATACNTFKKIDNLISPVILDNVTLKMRIAHEEQFGPILPIIEFNDIEDAIKWSNDTPYGLQASVFTRNIGLANKIATQLVVGSVNINGASQRGPDILPFVGVKGSGLATQGIEYALHSVVREFNIINNK